MRSYFALLVLAALGCGSDTTDGAGGAGDGEAACAELPKGSAATCYPVGPVDMTRVKDAAQGGVSCGLPAELYEYRCDDAGPPEGLTGCVSVDGLDVDTTWCPDAVCLRFQNLDYQCPDMAAAWECPAGMTPSGCGDTPPTTPGLVCCAN